MVNLIWKIILFEEFCVPIALLSDQTNPQKSRGPRSSDNVKKSHFALDLHFHGEGKAELEMKWK